MSSKTTNNNTSSSSCLICSFESTNSPNLTRLSSENTVLEKELEIVYILQNILQIPSSLCIDLLCESGHPSEWGVELCSVCNRITDESYLVFTRIRSLVKDSDTLLKRLRSRVHVEKEDIPPSFSVKRKRGPCKIIKAYLRDKDKKNQTDALSKFSTTLEAQLSNVSQPISEPSEDNDAVHENPDGTISQDESAIKREFLGDFLDWEIVSDIGIQERVSSGEEDSGNNLSDSGALPDGGSGQNLREISQEIDDNASMQGADDDEISDSDSINNNSSDSEEFQVKFKPNSGRRQIRKRKRDYKREYLRRPKKPRKGLYQCEYCPFSGPNSIILEAHVLRKHEDVKSPYSCIFCTSSFQKLARVLQHIDEKHQSEISNEDGKVSLDSLFIVEDPPPCQQDEESVTGKTERQKSKCKPKIRKSKPGEHKCDQCNYHFTLRWLLDAHILRCHYDDLTPFVCDLCDKRFQRKSLLFQHRQDSHELAETSYEGPRSSIKTRITQLSNKLKTTQNSNQKLVKLRKNIKKVYHCKLCDLKLDSKIGSEIHVKAVHEGEKPYSCKFCGKKYSDQPTYNRHVETHGDKVYTCEVCGKEFKVWHSFRLHSKTHGKLPRHENVEEVDKGGDGV